MDTKIEQLQRRQVRPTTPGEMLREVVFPELGITQTELAKRLGVSRRTLVEVLHEKRPLSTDMAWRLGKLIGNGAALWINMQHTVDTWDALHVNVAKYEDIEPLQLRKVG